MKKLTLNMDALTVETFSPVADRARGRGTVRGRESEDTAQLECGYTEPVVSAWEGCTWENPSCYASQCQETYWADCTDVGMCSVVNCQSIGEC